MSCNHLALQKWIRNRLSSGRLSMASGGPRQTESCFCSTVWFSLLETLVYCCHDNCAFCLETGNGSHRHIYGFRLEILIDREHDNVFWKVISIGRHHDTFSSLETLIAAICPGTWARYPQDIVASGIHHDLQSDF